MAEMTRRTFVKAGAAAGVAAFSIGRAYGANERIGLGFIGVGNRGSQLIQATLPNNDVDYVAVCDVYEPNRAKWAAELPGQPAAVSDYRRLLENKDIDAVLIATPDHWHALQTIDACRAGKDVYVEKPLSLTVREGRRMVEVARETQRVVQVGVHRRSGKHYQEVAERVRRGDIGKVTVMQCYRINNMAPNGIGHAPDSEPPAGLDWDAWLGPQAARPFRETIAPYKFRWWNDYSSQVANWAVHYFDTLRWMTGDEAPAAVMAMGGIYAVDDDRTIPDTMQAVFELPSGCLLIFGQYEASGAPALKWGEVELRGTDGTLYASTTGYRIYRERGGQFQDPAYRGKDEEVEAGDSFDKMTQSHIRNFLDCVRSRELPNADVEVGHRSTTFSHLAKIALATKSRIEWDPQAERITNNEAANDLLHYQYRDGYNLG